MASIKLDMINYLDDDGKLPAHVLIELTKNLPVTFDVTKPTNEQGGTYSLEFTGRPADLALLVRRYEEDPDMRKDLWEEIQYVAPMPGSTVTS